MCDQLPSLAKIRLCICFKCNATLRPIPYTARRCANVHSPWLQRPVHKRQRSCDTAVANVAAGKNNAACTHNTMPTNSYWCDSGVGESGINARSNHCFAAVVVIYRIHSNLMGKANILTNFNATSRYQQNAWCDVDERPNCQASFRNNQFTETVNSTVISNRDIAKSYDGGVFGNPDVIANIRKAKGP